MDAPAWMRGRALVPLLLLLGMLLRLWWALSFDVQPTTDYAWYIARGLALAHGEGYTIGGISTAYFPPAYPAFLGVLFSLFGDGLLVVRLGNVLLQTITLALLYLLSRLLWHAEIHGRTALLLGVLYPNDIASVALPGSEHLFNALTLLGVVLLLRGARSLPVAYAAGVVLGAAALTRTQGLLVPIVLLLWMLGTAMRARQCWQWARLALLVTLGLGLTLSPWLIRNARVLGAPVLTTTGGINLYLGNHAAANGAYSTSAWFTAMTDVLTTELAEDRACRQQILAELRADPGRLLWLAPRKLSRLYGADVDGVQYVRQHTPALPAAWIGILTRAEYLSQGYYTALWLALVLVLLRRPRQPAIGLLLLAAFTLVHLLFYGMPRYHAPMMPWVIVYAAGALHVTASTHQTSASPRR